MTKDSGKRSKAVSKHGKAREPEGVKRVVVGFRVTPLLRQQLEEAAAKRGRSLSQEAEFRLESTFAVNGLVGETLALAYGEDVARAMFTVADTIRTAHTVTELPGISDANRQTLLAGCRAGLVGLIDKLIVPDRVSNPNTVFAPTVTTKKRGAE